MRDCNLLWEVRRHDREYILHIGCGVGLTSFSHYITRTLVYLILSFLVWTPPSLTKVVPVVNICYL